MQENLSEKSYFYLRGKLTRGELGPGAQLVNRSLATEIGVSVTPVREAINRLASEGLVEQVPGGGAFVRSVDRQDLEECYVVRDALESCAAAEAARYITDDQLDELEAIVDEWCEIAAAIGENGKGHATREQLNRWLDNEEHFHDILVRGSRNRLLAKVVRDHRVINAVFEAQRDDPAILTGEVAAMTSHGRRELMRALRNRDHDQARQLVSAEIQRGKRTVLAFLRRKRR